jgi:hypothetical protein
VRIIPLTAAPPRGKKQTSCFSSSQKQTHARYCEVQDFPAYSKSSFVGSILFKVAGKEFILGMISGAPTTVVFRSNRQSRITRLSISKFGKGHASHCRLSNLPSVTQGSKLPVRLKKAKIFDSMSKISRVSCQILAVVEMSNRFFRSRITPSVDLNEILQYANKK